MKIISNAPSKIINGLNEIGDKAVNTAKRAGSFVKDKADVFMKKESIKDASKKVNKKTLVGAGVVLVGLSLAAKCLIEILKKVSEITKK